VDVMEVLREVLYRHRETVLFAYLFGSLAEGRGGPLSDVDVAAFLSREAASYRADGDGFFDGVIDFGEGNPQVYTATFVLSGTGLSVDTFNDLSRGNNKGHYTVAAHIQTTSGEYSSEFVGGNPGTPVPEPTSLLLLGLGILGIAASQRALKK